MGALLFKPEGCEDPARRSAGGTTIRTRLTRWPVGACGLPCAGRSALDHQSREAVRVQSGDPFEYLGEGELVEDQPVQHQVEQHHGGGVPGQAAVQVIGDGGFQIRAHKCTTTSSATFSSRPYREQDCGAALGLSCSGVAVGVIWARTCNGMPVPRGRKPL